MLACGASYPHLLCVFGLQVEPADNTCDAVLGVDTNASVLARATAFRETARWLDPGQYQDAPPAFKARIESAFQSTSTVCTEYLMPITKPI
jgi:hypothetical protein